MNKLVITVDRIFHGDTATIGEMSIDNNYLCDTLEDVVRPDGVKEYGKTAIPAGTYKVVLSMSNRFKKLLPEILNVPMFTGVRIHSGNHSGHTEGCILVGTWDGLKADWISDSRDAMKELMEILQKAVYDKKEITITIRDISK